MRHCFQRLQGIPSPKQEPMWLVEWWLVCEIQHLYSFTKQSSEFLLPNKIKPRSSMSCMASSQGYVGASTPNLCYCGVLSREHMNNVNCPLSFYGTNKIWIHLPNSSLHSSYFLFLWLNLLFYIGFYPIMEVRT